MRNADFGSSRVVRADFSGADLTSSLPIDAEHLPDRSRLAVIVGCLYDDVTKTDRSLPGMRHDRTTNRLVRALMRSEETPSELQSLQRNPYAVFFWKNHKKTI